MKVYVKSYGCTQNAGEARLMEETILARGHGIARRPDDADTNVLVTCTVVGTLSVLTTEPGQDRTTLARTDAYKQVVLDTDLPIGEFHTARILAGREADLLGDLISSAET